MYRKVVTLAKSATINFRVDPNIKEDAEQLYSSFGLRMSDALNMFLYQSIMVGGLPFELRQPKFNAETEEAIAEGRDIISGKKKVKSYSSVEELFAELDK
ncbi:MAG: type II toxin-antitoxin system RelB/DinJ family antitoxin [Candidatus Methanoplasma sp.]|jgi:DNA-damage-inducible protein J|nr:type II toxin-antitoxin system RelB/DinJ family antitoxin [Candidatus Methanoplasma sp.]